MKLPDKLADAPWLNSRAARAVFKVLDGKSGRTRAVGGIVRDSLLGIERADVDMATEFTPGEVIARAETAGIAAKPTGIEHGTVTLVHQGTPIEVTTLRADIETDGRHAVVRFGTDWAEDAARRDFTMNAIYAFSDGRLYDPLGGREDCLARRVRFIGDADQRIREDYLRILRFFRFFAVYGDGRPDAEGLKACTRLKPGLAHLSAERVWSELKKLLGATDPSRALLWMRTTGVLTEVLRESEKWGIDLIHPLVATERALKWAPDPLLRLAAIIPPVATRAEDLAMRLKFSNAERARLIAWAESAAPPAGIDAATFGRALYRGDPAGIADRLRLAIASARGAGKAIEARALRRLLTRALDYERPEFPLKGKDLVDKGLTPGPEIGRKLKRLEDAWVESGFTLGRKQLLAMAAAPARPRP